MSVAASRRLDMNTSVATSASSSSAAAMAGFQSHKRQRLSEDGASSSPSAPDTSNNSSSNSNSGEGADAAQKNGGAAFGNMTLSLQKDASWSTMLGDVDSFGGLGPIPSMNTVLEKRTSSQFSISSLLPSAVGVSASTADASNSSTITTSAASTTTTTTTATADADASAAALATPVTEGSGGNQKYMDAATGEYMYPENVKPMTFYDKQRLVQKITLLPSQYLRGLMDVISKYQPDTVRQIDDDGYAFDLGQMNENTVWAISDYVKDSMIELDGYIKSIASNGMVPDDRAGNAAASQAAMLNASSLRQFSNELALNSAKMSAISANENQNKFMEQVEMYSKPKVTKSRVKPSKKHECPTCSKQFRGRSELQNHIRTHTGEKPLKCSYAGCSKRYAHSSNLRAHERTHAGVKPYACHYDGCGKSFAHSVSLKEHIWMHAGFQPYVCPYEGCEKRFTQVSNFARHKKTHEKDERAGGGSGAKGGGSVGASDHEHSVESDN